MAEIQDKTREWSERFGSILRLSPETVYPQLYKGAVGGLEHVISADNGAYYMEMWRDGGDQYYATTGAAIKPLPGLAKGVRLDEALDRFFVLMAKVEKAGGARVARDDGQRPEQRPQRKAIPKKLKRLAGVRKNIVEKVDPEIGPSFSVGHRKPSDLSPESSMRKMARLIVNNVVALTGNQPGSGRVKPARTRVTDPTKPAKQPVPPKTYDSKQGFSGRRMGGSGTPGASHSGMVRRDAMGRRTASRRSKPEFGRMQSKHDTPKSPHKEHMGRRGGAAAQQVEAGDWIRTQAGLRGEVVGEGYVGRKRWPAFKVDMGGGKLTAVLKEDAQLWHKAEGIAQARGGGGRKQDNLEGGRVGAGGRITPVKPATGGPGQPTSYGSTGQPQYRYGRKACVCDEVAKAMRAVGKQMPTTYRVTGPGGKRSKPIKLPTGAR